MSNARELAKVGGSYGAGGFAGMKNRVINGDMRIDQRRAGAIVTCTAGQNFAVDRFAIWTAQASKLTAQQLSGDGPVGFNNYLRIATSTAYTPSGTAQYHLVEHPIEGYNMADMLWGTANAKPVTVSFWIRSSKTGAFALALRNAGLNRAFVTSYTINSANTWEYKSITVAGDTTGTWDKVNGRGVTIDFDMGASSDYNNSTVGSWSAVEAYTFSGAQSIITTLNATWDITGLQLEKGSQATGFEFRHYGTELALCQRYYWGMNGSNGNNTPYNVSWYNTKARLAMTCPVPMRASPTVTFSGATSGAFFATNDDSTYINFNYVATYGEQNNSGITTVNMSLTPSAAGPGGSNLYLQTGRSLSISAEL